MRERVAREFGLPWEKIGVIPNGVNEKDFHLDFDRAGFRGQYALPHEKLILYTGRLVYEKGLHTLLDAMPRILSSADAKLVIVGDGHLRDDLLAQAQRLGITQKIKLTGFVDQKTLISLYDTADVCVVPSLYEPFGIVALEAMAAKAPLVVSNVGGLSEIVEQGRDGLKVPPSDPRALADAVTKILTDPSFSEWIRTNAHDKVLRDYNWKGVANLTKRLYDNVLEEHRQVDWKPFKPLTP